VTKLQQMQKYLISTVISTVTGILFDRRTMTVIMTAFHMFQVKQTTCSQLKCSDTLKITVYSRTFYNGCEINV